MNKQMTILINSTLAWIITIVAAICLSVAIIKGKIVAILFFSLVTALAVIYSCFQEYQLFKHRSLKYEANPTPLKGYNRAHYIQARRKKMQVLKGGKR